MAHRAHGHKTTVEPMTELSEICQGLHHKSAVTKEHTCNSHFQHMTVEIEIEVTDSLASTIL